MVEGHTDIVSSIACANRVMVSGGYDRTVRVWDMSDYRMLRVLSGHDGAVRSVAINSGGELILSGGDDHNACVWSKDAPQPAYRLPHDQPVRHTAVHPALPIGATGCRDGRVKLWNLCDGQLLHEFHIDRLIAVDVSRSNGLLTVGNEAEIWQII